MECRYCGSSEVEYHGAFDGGGDYGEAVCDEWECYHCGNMFEGDCVGSAIDGNFFDDNVDHETPLYGEQIPFVAPSPSIDGVDEIPF